MWKLCNTPSPSLAAVHHQLLGSLRSSSVLPLLQRSFHLFHHSFSNSNSQCFRCCKSRDSNEVEKRDGIRNRPKTIVISWNAIFQRCCYCFVILSVHLHVVLVRHSITPQESQIKDFVWAIYESTSITLQMHHVSCGTRVQVCVSLFIAQVSGSSSCII